MKKESPKTRIRGDGRSSSPLEGGLMTVWVPDILHKSQEAEKMGFIQDFGLWEWWILGAVMIGVEIFMPGVFFLWLGLAALVTGLFSLIPGIPWEMHLVFFAVLGVAFAIIGKRFYGKNDEPTDHPNLSQRGAHYVGKVYALSRAVEDGVGKVKIGDSIWRATCEEDLPEGARVRVKDHDGATLVVEPVEDDDGE